MYTFLKLKEILPYTVKFPTHFLWHIQGNNFFLVSVQCTKLCTIDCTEHAQTWGSQQAWEDSKIWSQSVPQRLVIKLWRAAPYRANLSTLSKRCSQARMCHLFKIIHNLTDFPEAPLQSRSFHYSSRSNNSLPIVPYQCHSTQFLNSFFFQELATFLWNTLPTEAVTVLSCLL